MFYAIIVITAISLLVYYYLIKPHNYWKEKNVKQKKPMFFFGENLGMLTRQKSIAYMNLELYNTFDNCRYFGFYQMYLPTLLIKDPELIKQITVKDFEHFVDRGNFLPEEPDSIWAKNLFALTGQNWKTMRSKVSPSFTGLKMKFIFNLIAEAADNFVEHFLKKNEDVVTVELKDIFSRFTNDVIATTSFGIEVDSLENPNNEFYLMGLAATNFGGFVRTMKFLACMLFPTFFKKLGVSFFDKKVSNFFENLISETIKLRKTNKIIRNDMINILMESCNDKEIAGQAFIFFIAGFDSVSGLMSFMAYELAVNQEIQDKLREEILNTLEENDLTYETLMSMKYLDMVVSEALRKWPNAVVTDRVCVKPYTIHPQSSTEKPTNLNYGDVIFIPIFALQRDPKYFPNPEKFDPERFSDENKSNIVPYTYNPFGCGPRNCIGSRFAIMETKTIFFKLLTKFKIVPVQKTTIPVELSTSKFQLISEHGFWFGLEKL